MMFKKSFLLVVMAMMLEGTTCLAADTKVTAPAVGAAKTVTSDTAQTGKSITNRYVKIFQNNSYTYLMDMQTARWISCPHSGGEKIIDVWIKLVGDGSMGNATEPYSYPSKYFLEHYYIRPDKQQIQFLSELEVTGRPNNAITERSYNAANWENLVPGSVEEEIYHAVVSNADQLVKQNENAKTEGRDVLEELLRISL